MNRLLHFELRKLFHHVSFYVCGIFIIIFALLGVYTLSAQDMVFDMFGPVGDLFHSSHSGAELLVSAVDQIKYAMLVPIMISIFFCADFSDGTIKNIIGRGFSKSEVYFAKVITSAIAVLIYYGVGIVVCTVYATILWGFGDFSAVNLYAILVQAVGIVAFSTMCSLLSILFRKVAGALTLGIFTDIVFTALFTVTDLLFSLKEMDIRLKPFLLTSKITEAASISASASTITTSLLYCVLYGFVFTILGFLFFRKREV